MKLDTRFFVFLIGFGLAMALLSTACSKETVTKSPKGPVEHIVPNDAAVGDPAPVPPPRKLKVLKRKRPSMYCYEAHIILGDKPDRQAIYMSVCAEKTETCDLSRTQLEQGWKNITDKVRVTACKELKPPRSTPKSM